MAGETIVIGGVTYDKNTVTNYEKVKDSKGNVKYRVSLGEMLLSYPNQKNAKIEKYGNNAVGAYNLNGAVIYGTNNVQDQISLFGNSNNNIINVDDASDFGTQTGTTPSDMVQLPKDGKNNVVYKNSQDRVIYF